MPELPEVETVVRDLRPLVSGCTIQSVRVSRKPLRRRWNPEWNSHLIGRKILDVGRRGKWIVFELAAGPRLVFHLGMTGQLTVVPAERAVNSHTHLVMDLEGRNTQLRFRDVRRFGSARLFALPDLARQFFVDTRLGPEPFGLRGAYFRDSLAKTARCLKAALLDQRLVAGVGNIYADEALFEARLHPMCLGRNLEAIEADRLRRAIATVLKRAIDKGGSSIRDYIGGSELKGRYQDEFRVYGRSQQPCHRCGSPIQRIRLAGRSTHFCPKCQEAKKSRKGKRCPIGR